MAKATPKNGTRRSAAEAAAQRSRSIRCVSTYERLAREQGFLRIAGIDEVGRGCLFGPVFAAAVLLDPQKNIPGLKDSKVLSALQRTELAEDIKSRCVAWAVGAADAFEIDQINIYHASKLAMKRAVTALSVQPDYLLTDFVRVDLPIEQLPLVDGDAKCRAIAAASIIAKVHRDGCLDHWHRVFPHYNLASNKGYATRDHREALREHGPTMMHRFSFEPVRASSSRVFWTEYTHADAMAGLATG